MNNLKLNYFKTDQKIRLNRLRHQINIIFNVVILFYIFLNGGPTPSQTQRYCFFCCHVALMSLFHLRNNFKQQQKAIPPSLGRTSEDMGSRGGIAGEGGEGVQAKKDRKKGREVM